MPLLEPFDCAIVSLIYLKKKIIGLHKLFTDDGRSLSSTTANLGRVVGEKLCVTTQITAGEETKSHPDTSDFCVVSLV